MMDFFSKAKAGRIYLFRNRKMKFNSTIGEDLAKVCANNVLAIIKKETLGGIDI